MSDMQPMMARREIDDTGTMDNWLALAASIIANLSPSEACLRIRGVESIKTDPGNPAEAQRQRRKAYYKRHREQIKFVMRQRYHNNKAAARETAALHEGNNKNLSTLSVTDVMLTCQEKEG